MKRFLTFALRGPLIAGAVVAAVASVRAVFEGVLPLPPGLFLILIWMAALQVFPSLVAAGLSLAPLPLGLRMLVCSLGGMTAAGLIVAQNRGSMGMFITDASIAVFVAASAISAVVCAWLSRENQSDGGSNQNAGE